MDQLHVWGVAVAIKLANTQATHLCRSISVHEDEQWSLDLNKFSDLDFLTEFRSCGKNETRNRLAHPYDELASCNQSIQKQAWHLGTRVLSINPGHCASANRTRNLGSSYACGCPNMLINPTQFK